MSIKILGKFTKNQPSPAFFEGCLPAGFPSAAENFIENSLDLNELIVQHPMATFFVRVIGDSMIDAHIFSGDILVVDRSLAAAHGKIVVALLNGEFTVKRLSMQKGKMSLVSENAHYQPIEIPPESNFQVWGIVTYVIHRSR